MACRVHPLRECRGSHVFQPATLKVADEMKGDIMQKIIAVIIASAFALLAGCNTVEGFGQDVKGAGRGIEKAADKAKPN